MVKTRPLSRRHFKLKRKRQFRRIPRIQNRVYKFTRCTDVTIAVTDTATYIANYAGDGSTNYFALNLLPNYAEFTGLFDSYRITGVQLTWIYSANEAVGGTGYVNTLPILGTVEDLDDGTVLSSLSDYEQYQTYKEKRLDKICKMFVRPKPATAVYGGAFTSYATPSMKSMWIDCASAGVQFYGAKWYVYKPVATSSSTTYGNIRVRAKYYLEFKTVN